MLVSLLSYSQYPTVKKINNDSVVIMTLKQGEDINKRFLFLNDSIKKLNDNFNRYMIDNGQRLQKVYSDYNFEFNAHKMTKAEADSFKMMYLANKKIYLNSEIDHKREIRNLSIFTFISFLIAVFAVRY